MKWGSIGPGNIAHDFANDLQYVETKKCTVGPVLGNKPEHTKAFVEKYNCSCAANNIEEFINEKPDAVYIATPHPLHHQQALVCLENKIPVLCEKPLAINSQQVSELTDSSKKNNTFLLEGMWTRFLPSFQFLFQIIQSNTIGKVLHLHADMSFIAEKDKNNRFFNPELGGGSLLDVGVYTIYLSYFLLGNPDEIFAAGKLTEQHIDETCGVMLKYKNGNFALLESSIVTQTEGSAWIYGSDGTIRIKKPWTETPEKIEVIINNESSFKHIPSWPGRGFQYEVEEVIKCLNEKRIESDIVPHSASLDVVKIMDSVREQLGIVYPENESS
ncbi:MAG TPA: Gfo/Idh/MocA family oxidoreductase [Parafilimonas sp.]|nr:Gfo/Idh/MocA family oxidoreductase [Parafilimonas sp.]